MNFGVITLNQNIKTEQKYVDIDVERDIADDVEKWFDT